MTTVTEYRTELDIAVAAVRRAAILCQAVRRQMDPATLEKKDRSPVTVADFGSQALVCQTLGEQFPDDPIIAEEDSAALKAAENAQLLDRVVQHVCQTTGGEASADTVCGWIDRGCASEHADRYWTLDPIDGTKGFLRDDQYAVALALMVEGRPVVSTLACPNLPLDPADPAAGRGAVFTAIQGQGAYVHPLDAAADAGPRPIRVTDTQDAAAARFCESVESGHSSHDDAARIAQHMGITAEPCRMDSQAKYAVVARGEADLYMRLPTRADYHEKIWDHAPGALIVEEAGGTITDITGKPLDFTHGAKLQTNRGILVSNTHLHDALLHALKDAGLT